MGTPFDFLIPTNKWLEKVPINIINAFENFIGTGEHVTQEKVDQICAWLAWKVNIMIERKRQEVLKKLHGMYQNTVGGKVMQMANAVSGFISDPLGSIGAFASALGGPIPKIIQWSVILLKEIPKLAANLAKIVSALPPQPPNPSINYDKFKLRINSISMSAITSDPSSLPAPEVMFPEPEKPFSKEGFKTAFENASAGLKSSKQKFVLTEEDKLAMEALKESYETQALEITRDMLS